MSATRASTAAPDLGPVRRVRDDRVPGGWIINLAGVVEMARTGQTRQCAAFYEAFCMAYERVADLPMTNGAKQRMAFAEAAKAAGFAPLKEVEPPSAA